MRGEKRATCWTQFFPSLPFPSTSRAMPSWGRQKSLSNKLPWFWNNDNPPIHMSAVYWFLLLSTFLDYGRYIIWTWLIFFWARVSSSWGWLWLLISLPLLPSAWITCMRHCCVALFLLRWDTDRLFVLDRKPATDQSNNATKVHLGKKSFVGFYWQKIWVRGYKSKDDSKTPASLKIPPQCRWEMES